MSRRWNLPDRDSWSTPFAQSLLAHLDLQPGLSILDVACGDGIPAFYLADQVGPGGSVLGVDVSPWQVARARTVQGGALPWCRFLCADVRQLPETLPKFDRITGNLSVMFFRPDRPAALRGLLAHLKPAGQLVLTFPSVGTFASLWAKVDRELIARGHRIERERFQAYLAERPSAQEVRAWLAELGMERIRVEEQPLEVHSEAGPALLHHPLLRGGFLDDVYECFTDAAAAEAMMQSVAEDLSDVQPLLAMRCVMSGWAPASVRSDVAAAALPLP